MTSLRRRGPFWEVAHLDERELAVERWELEHVADEERRELELIYEAKGLAPEMAEVLAARIMADPGIALDTLAREERGLNPGDLGSPWSAAPSSFFAFAAGAIVPLLPFVVAAGQAAVVVSVLVSAAALAAAGAVISIFTGRRPAWRSGLGMVAIGGGAALVTDAIGSLVGVTLDETTSKE